MTTSDVLRAAAKRLREQGWTQGVYGGWAAPVGPCCLIGAVRSTCLNERWRGRIAIDNVRRRLGLELSKGEICDTSSDPVAKWNDFEGRTAEEVIALLETTAAELEAQEQDPDAQETP